MKDLVMFLQCLGVKKMNVDIRLAKKDEVLEIAKVKQKCWDSTYRGIYDDNIIDNFDYEKTANTFLSIIEDEDSDLYVVIVEDKIVGFMSCGKILHPYNDYEVELGMLYILKEYQGEGIGTMCFMLAKDNMKRKGFKKFVVSANKYNNRAREFYKKMGGVEIHVDEDKDDRRSVQVKYDFSLE